MKTLIKTPILFTPLIFFKIILNRINHKIAKKNIKENPQLAIFSFDHIGLLINLDGRYENSILRLIELFINSNIPKKNRDIAIDVGANIGNHSIFFSKFFKEVHSFEPSPFTYEILNINSKFASVHKNIKTYKLGISDKDGTMPFLINRSNIGGSKIDHKNEETKDHINVPVKSIDSLDDLKGKNISLIKIDVEGHEINVLRGAKKIIRSSKPVILFEQATSDLSDGASESIDYLSSLGYCFYTLKRRFEFGENNIAKIFSVFLRTIFGDQLSFVKTKKISKKFHHLILAIHT